ncbi:Kunitz/Bovine pancreatic trypsin inhibitor domain protein [Ancylostoma duodenale]|uniref:Kunitz/Bovine pancreatic trypsin inhibitor domain protein n=1 Tax=Ancylostoma duodenale TaxID=51022 RepID=A0A0C2GGV3_9BILA|nr:Kunitz/Bovine pancreatic trypsin inhibitor domain protein [Ancylostoma duodenale]
MQVGSRSNYDNLNSKFNTLRLEHLAHNKKGRARGVVTLQQNGFPNYNYSSNRAYETAYYYDHFNGVCKEFVYGGCGGNANRFETADDCATRCARRQQGRRELSRTFYDDDLQPLVPNNENDQEVADDRQEETSDDDINDDVLRGIDYDEKKVLAIQRGSLSPYTLPELCGLPEEHGSCYDDILRWSKMPRSSGPCRDAISMWYFDSSDETCKQFTYSGCRGNENRFATKEQCDRKCIQKRDDEDFSVIVGEEEGKEGTKQSVDVQLKVNPDRGFSVGDKIELTCDTQGLQPIVWRKNGHLLQFTRRVQEYEKFTKVKIARAIMADSGEYQCAAGPDGILSNAIAVTIKSSRENYKCTKDAGTQKTCALIVQNGLCSKKRYKEFCCKSCQSA